MTLVPDTIVRLLDSVTESIDVTLENRAWLVCQFNEQRINEFYEIGENKS